MSRGSYVLKKPHWKSWSVEKTTHPKGEKRDDRRKGGTLRGDLGTREITPPEKNKEKRKKGRRVRIAIGEQFGRSRK